ncbi:MAG: ABC transporter permease [Tepidisphaeraceae bacterium]|jgi:ABC-type dipeptide/oligopeptide/nickel transport system permease subunit
MTIAVPIESEPSIRPWRRVLADRRVSVGGAILGFLMLAGLLTMPWTQRASSDLFYDRQHDGAALKPPQADHLWMLFGTTKLGTSLLGQCLIGGVISLSIGLAAAAISVVLGVGVGVVCGYYGGWIDSLLMRIVDILFALPYFLMVILLKLALEPALLGMHFASVAANLTVLFLSIGLVSWLEMARVIRGQVLSLRTLPFVEAARAAGLPQRRIFLRHLLPNLLGPIIVYATLMVPQAILQESVLSFLGIGIQKPLPTWGALASDGLTLALNPISSCWWLLAFPCTLLAVTLLALNFIGDGLRDTLDPRGDRAKI